VNTTGTCVLQAMEEQVERARAAAQVDLQATDPS
jgi:hypothetical protein